MLDLGALWSDGLTEETLPPVFALSSCFSSCYRLFTILFGELLLQTGGLEAPIPLDALGRHFLFAAISTSNFCPFLQNF